jgi:hypothetical protein
VQYLRSPFAQSFKSQLLFTHQQTPDLREQIGIRNGRDTPFLSRRPMRPKNCVKLGPAKK